MPALSPAAPIPTKETAIVAASGIPTESPPLAPPPLALPPLAAVPLKFPRGEVQVLENIILFVLIHPFCSAVLMLTGLAGVLPGLTDQIHAPVGADLAAIFDAQTLGSFFKDVARGMMDLVRAAILLVFFAAYGIGIFGGFLILNAAGLTALAWIFRSKSGEPDGVRRRQRILAALVAADSLFLYFAFFRGVFKVGEVRFQPDILFAVLLAGMNFAIALFFLNRRHRKFLKRQFAVSQQV